MSRTEDTPEQQGSTSLVRRLANRLSRLRTWRTGRVLGDRIVTSSAVRWTWTGMGPEHYSPVLTDFRSLDSDSVHEMLGGRWLLASQLVDTGGGSPFEIRDAHPEWIRELQSFSWLRHFKGAQDETGRRLAQTLVFDWIARFGSFHPETWHVQLVAMRVMNWLRHYSLISEGLTPSKLQTH